MTCHVLPQIAASDHFLRRLHARFPELRLTESRLLVELHEAEWYAASGGENVYYVPIRMRQRTAVFVVAREREALALLTVYEPVNGWDRRLGASRGCPGKVVINGLAKQAPPRPYKGAR